MTALRNIKSKVSLIHVPRRILAVLTAAVLDSSREMGSEMRNPFPSRVELASLWWKTLSCRCLSNCQRHETKETHWSNRFGALFGLATITVASYHWETVLVGPFASHSGYHASCLLLTRSLLSCSPRISGQDLSERWGSWESCRILRRRGTGSIQGVWDDQEVARLRNISQMSDG